MSNNILEPYLFFGGDCKQAMQFYKEIFGGELYMQTYEEGPGTDNEAMKDKIIHANLKGGDVEVLASDTPNPDDLGAGKISLCLVDTDEQKLREYFDKLSDGANVTYPLTKEFWGDIYGTLTDKFGINWMINISANKE